MVGRRLGEWLCRFGLHSWSTNRGGIKICRRECCQRARTYGITGAMRQIQFEKDLYKKYQAFEDGDGPEIAGVDVAGSENDSGGGGRQ